MEVGYHVYVGAETGLIKGVNVEKNKWDNLLDLKVVDRGNEVCVMCWENQSEVSVVFGTRGGAIRSYSKQTGVTTDMLQVTESDVLKGLFKLDSKFVTCTDTGKLCVWEEPKMTADLPSEAANDCLISVNCGENVFTMKPDPFHSGRVALAGKENDLKLYDLQRLDAGPVFKAKNVRDDWLDLRVPVWVTDVGFIHRAASSDSLLITCTGYHQIRLYDPNTSQRRPMVDMTWEEHPLTCLSVLNQNNRQIMVGNSIGEQALIDLRNKKCLGKFKGGAGSIKSLQCHPNKPLVASCGLDRYLRIHDTNSRILLNKIYMKSRLNKLLMVTDWDSVGSSTDAMQVKEEVVSLVDPAEQREEDDELWESLESVVEDKSKVATKHKLDSKSLTKAKKRRGKSKSKS